MFLFLLLFLNYPVGSICPISSHDNKKGIRKIENKKRRCRRLNHYAL